MLTTPFTPASRFGHVHVTYVRNGIAAQTAFNLTEQGKRVSLQRLRDRLALCLKAERISLEYVQPVH